MPQWTKNLCAQIYIYTCIYIISFTRVFVVSTDNIFVLHFYISIIHHNLCKEIVDFQEWIDEKTLAQMPVRLFLIFKLFILF